MTDRSNSIPKSNPEVAPKTKSKAKPKIFYGYFIAVGVALVMFIIFVDTFAFGVFFKPVSEIFHWDREVMSGAFFLSSVMIGVTSLVFGPLNDRWGPRIILTFSGVITGLGFILMSRITSIWQLYLYYGVLIGIGEGAAFAPGISTLMRWFTKNRSLMTGVVLAVAGVGTTSGPLIADRLIKIYNWHNSYILLGAATLVIIVAAAQFLKRDPAKMGLKPYGEEESQAGPTALEGLSPAEARHTRQLWTLIVIELLFGFVFGAIMVHLVPYITDLKISSSTAALILATAGCFSIFGRLSMGLAGDKLDNRRVFIIGLATMTAAFIWLLLLKEVVPLFIFGAAFGFAFGGVQSSESPIVAWLFGIRSHGAIFGMTCSAFTIGSGLGSFLTGLIYDASQSYHTAFIITLILSLTGLGLTVSLRRLGKV